MRNANSRSLCIGTRREVFVLLLHDTPYNVMEIKIINHIIILHVTPYNVMEMEIILMYNHLVLFVV